MILTDEEMALAIMDLQTTVGGLANMLAALVAWNGIALVCIVLLMVAYWRLRSRTLPPW